MAKVTATIDPYFVTTVDSESDEIGEDAVSLYLASTVPDVSPQRSDACLPWEACRKLDSQK